MLAASAVQIIRNSGKLSHVSAFSTTSIRQNLPCVQQDHDMVPLHLSVECTCASKTGVSKPFQQFINAQKLWVFSVPEKRTGLRTKILFLG